MTGSDFKEAANDASKPVKAPRALRWRPCRQYRIADNQLARLSDFDNDKLAAELMELQTLDFDLDLTGFSTGG